MSIDFDLFLKCLKAGAAYIPVTVEIAVVSFLSSIVFGIIIAAIRVYKIPVLSQILTVFVTIYLGVPITVALLVYNLLFFNFYADIAAFLHISTPLSEVNMIIVAFFGLILMASCNMSEAFRGAFLSIEKVQFEAGYTIGLTKLQTFWRIILPQMIPAAAPMLSNMLIGLIKSTNLVSVVGVIEVMGAAILPGALLYRYFEGYLAAATIYWAISIVLEFVAKQVEKLSSRYRRKAA